MNVRRKRRKKKKSAGFAAAHLEELEKKKKKEEASPLPATAGTMAWREKGPGGKKKEKKSIPNRKRSS